MIKKKHLNKASTKGMKKVFRGRWSIYIKGVRVSIVRFNKRYYSGAYEIYGYDNLFYDVERYKRLKEVLKRLNELEKDE